MRAADVVIVGAGVVGASVAYHLASRGCRDVVVLERHARLGEGSTGRATGGFRAQFGSEINVRLSLLSREKLLRFRDEVGADPGFRRCGYLFLGGSPRTLELLAAARDVQRRAGLTDTRIVDVEEVGQINPAVRLEGVLGGAFGPSDGFLRPQEILRGYVEAARRLGVRFFHREPCLGFRASGDRLSAVETASGAIPAGAVVNAAGAWAAAVAGYAGVDLPVRPLRRQVAITGPFDRLPECMPMTIFVEDGFHLRVRDGRVLLLRPDSPSGPDPFDLSVDRSWFDGVVARARNAIPCLREASIHFGNCWAGLYEISPDGHALLGTAPGTENLYLANGSSGHGIMHAPALGHLLAEIILDGRASTIDIDALRPGRFADGEPNAAPTLL
ncbi:MAG TPA: FAD-binding oxidoreductase [Longimicrobiaceae bacterium]|nr:FAD-binding oxidoreductase [Longimicrobiaceae bacterium]